MIRGIERLRKAEAALKAGDEAALAEAAHDVWDAMADLPEWPTDLRMRAVELQTDLFRDGSVRATLAGMTDADRLRLRRELVAFCEHAERLDAAGGRAGNGSSVNEATANPAQPASALGA